MSGMEAALAAGLLKVAGGKLVSLITSGFASIAGMTNDLSDLHDIHLEIASRLTTVCDRAIDSDPSLRWVMKLRNIAYDIYDLLDEVHLDAEKHMIESEGDKHAIADCFCAKPKAFMFRRKMARKIKAIKVTYAAVVKQRSDANTVLNYFPVDHRVGSRNTTTGELSMLGNVEEFKIPTRDHEKGEIICKLLESNEGEDGWIVSIVGLGGAGKTTLVKHICHDNKIKEHFKDTIFWVHVSQEFDVEQLIGKLFEAIIEKKSDLHARQHMLREISIKLGGKKFLLVLDDAWHEDRHDWEQFMVHLKSGTVGSKILITTRDRKVAEAVKSGHIFDLECLSEAESWSLFLKSSGWAEKDLNSDIIQIGKEIVNKCGGVPLAIKTLGGILIEKREISTWRAIGESDLWNVKSINDRVFASLKLSYIHLADELKQCFTFCSIFPKGYKIYKDRLIAQWIAHGFINPVNAEHLENIGSDYFHSLVKVSFLQDPSEDWNTKKVVWKMHDLIHDLARQILQHEVVTSLPKNRTADCTHRCRYLSLSSGTDEEVDRGLLNMVRAIYVSGGNPSFDKQIKKSCLVRSVILQYKINSPFPMFVLKFEYIGFLEIHNVRCTELPEAISGCWNLQALLFISCSGFVKLPESIGKLKKLRTLELEWISDLESLPQSIGDCRDLQSLQLNYCEKLREIPNSLGKIESLRVLHIVYGRFLPHPGRFLPQLQLEPFASHALHTLNLSGTRVTTLPQWITLNGTLECIDLGHCKQLVELPEGIGNLKSLKVLNLEGCLKLHGMPSGFGQLTALRKLGLFVVGCGADDAMISELENLDMLSGHLCIRNLAYLKDPGAAEKACLKRKNNIQGVVLSSWSADGMEEELVSDAEQDLGVLDALEPPSEIKELVISDYPGPILARWMRKQTDSSYLEGVMLKQGSPRQFLSLTKLTLEYLPNLKHLRGLVVLPSLKTLKLRIMPNLEELWTTTSGLETGEEEVGLQYCFPILSNLQIENCPKLIVKPYFPPSVESLTLENSNEQLLSPGSSFSRLHPPHVDEPSSSSRALVAVPHLKVLTLVAMTGSSSGWEFLQHLNELEFLNIRHCPDLRQLPESMRGLTSLLRLWIDDCPVLDVLPEWLGELRSLKLLEVLMTPMVASLPESIMHLTSLVTLRISGWDNLKQLPEAIQHLTSLQCLHLEECSALTVLPEWIGQLSALQHLSIFRCPALQSP